MSTVSLTLDTQELAQHYERISAAHQFKGGQMLIEELAIRPGEKVLDVGSGTGLLAEYVAGLVGPTGAIIGVDPLPLRIALAQAKGRANLSFKVGTADDLREFPEAGFDVVYLNAVFHWLPEKLEPLRQIYRVLKKGGRLGLSTGSKDHPNQLQTIKAQVLAREPYSRYLEASGGGMYRVSADELRSLLSQSGFAVQKLEVRPHVRYHPSPQAAIEFAEASSFGNFLGHLPEALRTAAREEIKRELEQFRTPEGIRREGGRIIAIAIRS
ncbi:MAG: methyltransferase domain-containing protein [Deltaproteobacteria bacterium]|nr:methyltransferase domain-containing protein [Deltaproteobacteria bacterium]